MPSRIFKHGGFGKAQLEKIQQLEARGRQRILQTIVIGVPLLGFYVSVVVHMNRIAGGTLLGVFLYAVPAGMALGVMQRYGGAFLRYTTTSRQAQIQGWLLLIGIVVYEGRDIGNQRLMTVAVAVVTLAYAKRSIYGKLGDAIILWEPDDKNSVYHNFADADQAAKLL